MNRPDLSPSPELSYVLGVYYSDGSIFSHQIRGVEGYKRWRLL